MADPTNNELDIGQILIAGRRRWLRPTEICVIIQHYMNFLLAPEPPYKPRSGTCFLFDRKVLRHFGEDGHNWWKKRDGKTVEEACERIKVGSIDVLYCYYAHGKENENFQRRSYWMLEEKLSHIVLVQYLEDKISNAERERFVKACLKSTRKDLSLSTSVSSEGDSSHSAPNRTSTGHHDGSVHAAAIRIQNKFRGWKGRKDFVIIRMQIIKIQAHVRGHQVRKNYKKIVWSVKILEKFFLCWRQKRSGLCGMNSEAHTNGGSSMLDTSSKEEEFNFLKDGRKQKERWSKALTQVTSMVQYPDARDQYPFNGNTLVDNYQGKFSVVRRAYFNSTAEADMSRVANDAVLTHTAQENLDFPSLEDVSVFCAQGVGSQSFPSFSSTQSDNPGNIPKEGQEILGGLSINRFDEQKEFQSHQPFQGELKGTTSTKYADGALESVVDYTNEFTDNKVFKSKEALVQWTQEFGRKNGFVIVIKRSDLGNGGTKPRITFCCERGGQYRNIGKDKEDKKEKQLRNTSTKKCGCPFTLKGRKLSGDDNWMLEVVSGVHNHPITKPLEGRSYAGRLSKKETSLLIDMSKSMARPKEILVTLRKTNPNNASTRKQIYNALQRCKKVIEMPERSQMQQLLSKLSEHKYIEWHRSSDNSDIIKDLLWAHPVNIDLLYAFPHVLVMDTYKTNRYNLPLLEIEGVTSTNMSFVVAYAYLESEREDNYVWALQRLKSVMDDNALPIVILSDKELALMNAIARVFPATKHLLRRWYVSKNISTTCKKLFAINEIREKFLMRWNMVVLSSNEDEFTNHLNTLKREFSSYPQVIEYVTNTWLSNYKERFVSAWTDKIMHFGNLTNNRVESSHLMLKKQLRSNQGNFETFWGKIHSLLELQHTNIRASFDKSLTVEQDQFKTVDFTELQGFVSMYALHMIHGELKRVNSIGVDASTCECIIRYTHGLPCAHVIAKFKRASRPIPLDIINSYWRKLDLVPFSNEQKVKLSYESALDLIAKRIGDSDDDTKLQIIKKLLEIAYPQSTSLTEPEAKKEIHGWLNSKGDNSTPPDSSTFKLDFSRHENLLPAFTLKTVAWGPTSTVQKNKRSDEEVYGNKRLKSNKFVSSFPIRLQPYIHDINDVAADGNCGFRAIADLMGFGENQWLQVRKDLLKELVSNLELYSCLYGSNNRVEELIHTLSYFKSHPGSDQWMTMPDMGHLIASAYNVVLFFLSLRQCLTFLPLRSEPMPIDARKDIAIGFVNNNHFVKVFLLPDHPVPPIANNWYKFCHSCANGWDTEYIPRIQQFKKIIGNNVATNEIIDIDSPLLS